MKKVAVLTVLMTVLEGVEAVLGRLESGVGNVFAVSAHLRGIFVVSQGCS